MAYFPAPYSAITAISPAFERTRQFLFRPFRLWRFLKLALVACVVEAGGGFGFNFGIPPSGKSAQAPIYMPRYPWPPSSQTIVLITFIALACLVLGFVVSYLILRLRFAYFDSALFFDERIAPGWRRYHRQAMRYLGMSLCFGAVVLLFAGGVAALLIVKYRPLFAHMGPGQPLTFGELLPFVLTIILVAFVAASGLCVVDTALSFLVLPRMAIEDASIAESLREVWSDLTAEPGQFALFVLMRLLLPAAAIFVCTLILIIPMVILIVLAVLIGVFLHMTAAPGSILFLTVMGVVATIIGIGIFLPAGIAVGGTIGTFVRNYALLFYGGRYPNLGQLLWPPPPEPPSLLNVAELAPD